MEAAFRRTIERLSTEFAFQIVEMPPDFADLAAAVKLIACYEGARTHEARWREHGRAIGEKLAQLVEEGLHTPEDEYRAALANVATIKREVSALLREYPVLATPSAPGAAPGSLTSIGDPVMNLPWTALGVPAVSIPMPVLGLPLGLQLISEGGSDSALLALAAEVEALLL